MLMGTHRAVDLLTRPIQTKLAHATNEPWMPPQLILNRLVWLTEPEFCDPNRRFRPNNEIKTCYNPINGQSLPIRDG
jgi:hypothetical protein